MAGAKYLKVYLNVYLKVSESQVRSDTSPNSPIISYKFAHRFQNGVGGHFYFRAHE